MELQQSGLLRLAGDILAYCDDMGRVLGDKALEYVLWRQGKARELDLLDTALNGYKKSRIENSEVQFSKTPLKDSLNEADKEAEASADAAKAMLEERKNDIRGDLLTMLKAMSAQKAYDKETVDAIAVLAKRLMKEQDIDTFNRREIARLLGITKASLGATPAAVKKNADNLVEMIIDHLIKTEKESLDELLKGTGKRLNPSRVEVQGELDVHGQNVVKAFKSGLTMVFGSAV